MADLNKKQSIVLVDDEQDLLNLYKLNLKSVSANVMTFTDPTAALRYLEENPDFCPDLLVSDYMMPKMKGVEMIEQFLKLRPSVPTVLLSGFLDKEKVIDATNKGVSYILEKPVVREAFISIARSYLMQSRAEKRQHEMTEIMKQMSELFAMFRIMCMDELDLKAMHQPVISNDPHSNEKALSLEESMSELDARLSALVSEEIVSKKAA